MFGFLSGIFRFRSVAKAAFEEEKRTGRKSTLRANEREFQAAAIEIMETPPSPVGRMVGLFIIMLVGAVFVWSIIGRMDIIATLEGKIIPVGNIKVIEPLITGKVKTINVRQGQQVEAGELLIELDPTEQEADSEKLEEELIVSQAVSARLKRSIAAISKNIDAQKSKLPKLRNTPDDVRELQQNLLTRTLMTYEAEQASIKGEIQQTSMEIKRTKNTVVERNKLVEVMTERVNMLDSLAKSGSGSRASYLERAQLLYEQRADLANDKGKLAQLESAIATLKLKGKQKKEELLQSLTAELANNQKRIATLRQEVRKARTREKYVKLIAPVSGTVQQLAVHTVGDVLSTGQQAMVIVPKGTKLEVQANLLNKDKGFVKDGQDVRLKVETFNFTEYGVIPGKVLYISNDAINASQLPERQRLSSKGNTLVFPVQIALSRETITVNGEDVRLSPGMSVMAEIKTGERRVIDFLLSPLFRVRDEALKER